MKTSFKFLIVFVAILSLAGCGTFGGCGNLCAANNYLFNFETTSCCSTLPW